MAEHKVVNTTQLDSDLTSIANAIRAKAESSDALSFPSGFVDAIANLATGGGLPSNISAIAGGTFVLTDNTEDAPTLTHNLGVSANFYLIRVQGDLTTSKKVMYAMGSSLGGKALHVQNYYSTNGYALNQKIGSLVSSTTALYPTSFSGYTYASGKIYHWICGRFEEQ